MARVPILLVHGIRTSASMWRHQVDQLRADGHDVLAIDLPGHGTRHGEQFTVEAALDAIDAGVTALGGRVMLVGLSLGDLSMAAQALRTAIAADPLHAEAHTRRRWWTTSRRSSSSRPATSA